MGSQWQKEHVGNLNPGSEDFRQFVIKFLWCLLLHVSKTLGPEIPIL